MEWKSSLNEVVLGPYMSQMVRPMHPFPKASTLRRLLLKMLGHWSKKKIKRPAKKKGKKTATKKTAAKRRQKNSSQKSTAKKSTTKKAATKKVATKKTAAKKTAAKRLRQKRQQPRRCQGFFSQNSIDQSFCTNHLDSFRKFCLCVQIKSRPYIV